MVDKPTVYLAGMNDIVEVLLQKKHFMASIPLHHRLLDAMEPSVTVEVVSRAVSECVEVIARAAFPGETLKEFVVDYPPAPLDWWQAFRQRWFPKWWLKRWPVVQTAGRREVVKVDCLYPLVSAPNTPHALLLTCDGKSVASLGSRLDSNTHDTDAF